MCLRLSQDSKPTDTRTDTRILSKSECRTSNAVCHQVRLVLLLALWTWVRSPPPLEGLCREVSDLHNLEIQFVHYDIPEQTPKDVTLCLYRIARRLCGTS
jgi:hypothetical protein